MRKVIISFIYNRKLLHGLLRLFYVTVGKCRFQGLKTNQFDITPVNLYKDTFSIHGQKNHINIASGFVENTSITIKGSNNIVEIGEDSYINGLRLVVEGDYNRVIIGKKIFVLDDVRIDVVDGSMLRVGNNCMFSDRIDIRTTDSHSIIDMKSGKRVNPEKDIILGDDIWIGTGAYILKGAVIANGCIVGARSVITRKHENPNSIIAGNPGKEIREGTRWIMERV